MIANCAVALILYEDTEIYVFEKAQAFKKVEERAKILELEKINLPKLNLVYFFKWILVFCCVKNTVFTYRYQNIPCTMRD